MPQNKLEGLEKLVLILTLKVRSQRQDLNHAIVFLEKPKYFIFLGKI